MSVFDCHESWGQFHKKTDDIIRLYGFFILDNRCNKDWDYVELVYAELFGPEWGTHPDYLILADTPCEEPIDQRIIDAADRLIVGVDWCEKLEES